MPASDLDRWHMRRALELAARGRGHVEPNPLVGCLIARGAEIIGEGWHRRFGGPHAEIEALAIAGDRADGATLYVTLEPCCHHGKTPPCTDAIIAAGVKRVVLALGDPFPQVAGGGVSALRAAGIEVETDVLADEARRLLAAYLKLLATGRPWVIAKWAMSLDGKIATRTGASRWISGEASRRLVHELRGGVDAIIIGRGTAAADNPLLTARPAGPRVATRVVLDRRARLDLQSQLVRTAREVPVLVAVDAAADESDCVNLRTAGCEIYRCAGASPEERLSDLLDELGRRRMTNVLVEGGAGVLGSLADAGHIDEVHIFLAPLVIGGQTAPSPVAGRGADSLAEALRLETIKSRAIEGDFYLHGRVVRS